MSVTLDPATSLTVQQSIARVELFTEAAEAQANWRVVYHFEDGTYDATNKLVGKATFGTRRAERTFGAIQADSITTSDGKVTVTVAQLADLIKQAGYKYRAADVAAGK